MNQFIAIWQSTFEFAIQCRPWSNSAWTSCCCSVGLCDVLGNTFDVVAIDKRGLSLSEGPNLKKIDLSLELRDPFSSLMQNLCSGYLKLEESANALRMSKMIRRSKLRETAYLPIEFLNLGDLYLNRIMN